jgi:hypothetical protein
MNAKYECLKCHYKYEDRPRQTQCPKCKHLYVKWVNYQEWRTYTDLEEEKKLKSK